jgi:hypothetical protein
MGALGQPFSEVRQDGDVALFAGLGGLGADMDVIFGDGGPGEAFDL